MGEIEVQSCGSFTASGWLYVPTKWITLWICMSLWNHIFIGISSEQKCIGSIFQVFSKKLSTSPRSSLDVIPPHNLNWILIFSPFFFSYWVTWFHCLALLNGWSWCETSLVDGSGDSLEIASTFRLLGPRLLHCFLKIKKNLFQFIYFVCMYACGCTCALVSVWRSEDRLWKSVLCLHHLGSRSSAWQQMSLSTQ